MRTVSCVRRGTSTVDLHYRAGDRSWRVRVAGDVNGVEAAAIAGVTAMSVTNWRRAGRLAAKRHGRRYRYRVRDCLSLYRAARRKGVV